MPSATSTHAWRTSFAKPVRQYDTQGFANSEAINAKPCTFLSALARNKGSATLYLMFFDATAVPGNGATPAFLPVAVAAGASVVLDLSELRGEAASGFEVANGLCWAASTTDGTLTVDTSSSLWLTVKWT